MFMKIVRSPVTGSMYKPGLGSVRS